MAGARALLLLAAAVVALLAVPPPAAAARDNRRATLKKICKATSFPDVCIKTAGKHVKHHRTVDAATVLQMQVDAFAKRTAAARKRVAKKVASRASPAARTALNLCDKFYLDVVDNLGACRRAIRHRDGVTIRATMSMAAQDMQNCDEQFRQVGEKKNPLERFNQSLGKMAEVCRSLSNML